MTIFLSKAVTSDQVTGQGVIMSSLRALLLSWVLAGVAAGEADSSPGWRS